MKRSIQALLAIITVMIIAFVGIAFYLILSKPDDVLDRLEQVDTSREYFTALEAYQLIRPILTAWNSDAVITGIRGGTWHGREGIFSSADGRMPYWTFVACSTIAKEWTRVVLLRGYTGTSWGEQPGGELQGTCQAVPMELIIDTDVVINTARSRVNGLLPREIKLDGCDLKIPKELLCWNVVFEIPDSKRVQILLDAYSGEVVNIFLGFNDRENLGKDWILD